MGHLNRALVERLKSSTALMLPGSQQYDYPEKVIQFGTGVLLRGLTDQYIEDANRKGIFCGRVVVVKSTGIGSLDVFSEQEGLYTVCVKGLQDGRAVDQTCINASISRVLSATDQWPSILDVAASPAVSVVISNTTEVGIVDADDQIPSTTSPPSFPGKLLALLFHRFTIFNGDPSKGLVIVPTELIENNGDALKKVLVSLAQKNQLGDDFMHWLIDANPMCNSLVDRIVPGKMSEAMQQEKEHTLGYTDPLMIMAEPFRLWAIASNDPRVLDVLSFVNPDQGCFVVPDISTFKELKLRLLNGTHTFSCGVALLAGKNLVREAMSDAALHSFIKDLVQDEIAALVAGDTISSAAALQFAGSVIDRFGNPYIDHKWSSIAAQFTAKMKMRNVPLIRAAAAKWGAVPARMTLGFAAFLLCMDTQVDASGQYVVQHAHTPFVLTDSSADALHTMWQTGSTEEAVFHIMSCHQIWDTDLSLIPGFAESVVAACTLIKEKGIGVVLSLSLDVP